MNSLLLLPSSYTSVFIWMLLPFRISQFPSAGLCPDGSQSLPVSCDSETACPSKYYCLLVANACCLRSEESPVVTQTLPFVSSNYVFPILLLCLCFYSRAHCRTMPWWLPGPASHMYLQCYVSIRILLSNIVGRMLRTAGHTTAIHTTANRYLSYRSSTCQWVFLETFVLPLTDNEPDYGNQGACFTWSPGKLNPFHETQREMTWALWA